MLVECINSKPQPFNSARPRDFLYDPGDQELGSLRTTTISSYGTRRGAKLLQLLMLFSLPSHSRVVRLRTAKRCK